MSEGADQSSTVDEPSCTESWPSFGLRCTFNPKQSVREEGFAPDELFLFDPDSIDLDGSRWISAERGSYVPLEKTR